MGDISGLNSIIYDVVEVKRIVTKQQTTKWSLGAFEDCI
jgi:hypothetical protein